MTFQETEQQAMEKETEGGDEGEQEVMGEQEGWGEQEGRERGGNWGADRPP